MNQALVVRSSGTVAGYLGNYASWYLLQSEHFGLGPTAPQQFDQQDVWLSQVGVPENPDRHITDVTNHL